MQPDTTKGEESSLRCTSVKDPDVNVRLPRQMKKPSISRNCYFKITESHRTTNVCRFVDGNGGFIGDSEVAQNGQGRLHHYARST